MSHQANCILLSLLLAPACSSSKSPQAKTPTPSKEVSSAEMAKTEAARDRPNTSTIDLKADFDGAEEPMDLAGCPYVSRDQRQYACWHVLMDMGFGAVSLDIYEGSTSAPRRIELFSRHENHEDDWSKREAGFSEAQKVLNQGAFALVEWGEARELGPQPAAKSLRAKGKSWTVPLLDETRAQCCKWGVSSMQSTSGLTLLRAFGDCDWVDNPKDACHVEGYNDESYTSTERFFLIAE